VPAPGDTMTTTTTPPAVGRGGQHSRDRHRDGIWHRPAPGLGQTIQLAILALVAFVPLLAVRPGVVTDDTKTYLYLDPGKFLRQVFSMWNPDVALGTVTHEYIGYLLPMGPFYWLCSVLHLPLWVAQRLWLGAILFAAGAGVLFLCRTLKMRGPGTLVAAMAFMLSPYFLQYAGRISVILLPWAGLPWMVALAALALRRGGWKYPALFALVVALVSGINASSVLYAGLAPVLWLIYAVAVEREARWVDAAWVALKIAGLSLLVCLWWITGLQIEAAYGVNTLKFTETVKATSETSTASEVLRGLGYWYFYGGDRDGPWTFSSVVYTQYLWVIGVSFLLPVLSFLSAIFLRWRTRAYFVALVVVGVVLSVGAHPFESPTVVGGWLKSFMTGTTAGLAMRSTDRATPLVILGTAMLLGAGASALWRRWSWAGLATTAAMAGLVIANNPAIFNGDTIANGMTQPAQVPAYLQQATDYLNSVHQSTRVLGIPGDDFAVYNWGNTVDTPEVALLNRPYAIQEQQIMGSMATADMLYAIDQPIQAGTEQWNSLAPMARLISAGDLLVQNDIAYWRYGAPQPQILSEELNPTPPGLTDRKTFGKPTKDVPLYPTLDEQDLASPPNPKPPAPVVTYTVKNPRPIARAESNRGALVVAGDNTGLANLASTGMLGTTSAVYFSGTLDKQPSQLHDLMSQGADLVVTDTNRKQAMRWDGLTAITGFTETPSENLTTSDPSDSPLELFPGTGNDTKTTAYYVGAANVTASTYGDQVSYLPENRAYMAIDGNPDTSWETGAFVPNPSGQWWQLSLQHPATADHVRIVQPLVGNLSRWVTEATLTFDGGNPVQLGPESRSATGQVVSFPARSFRDLRVRIDATSNDSAPVATAGPVGFSSIAIPGVAVNEVLKMPTDLLDNAGSASLHNRLTMVMTRDRVSPYPVRNDPETTISRQFDLPTARTFTLSGTASLSALLPDDAIDRAVGMPGADGTGVVAYSSGRLPGDLQAGATAAIDGNPKTAWQPGFGASHQIGAWLQYNLPQPITFDHMNLQVLADGQHSVPTKITISTENGSETVSLPRIQNNNTPGSLASVPLTFPALTGSRIHIRIDSVRLQSTVNFYSPQPIALPVGIAELGIPGLSSAPVPSQLPGTCQSGLLKIDGHPISVRVVGSSSAALSNNEMTVQPCGADASGIRLGAGQHVVETAAGHLVVGQAGWNLDQIALDSAAGGAAMPLAASDSSTDAAGTLLAAPHPGSAPKVQVLRQASTSMHLAVSGATQPFELVLGQSINAGWKAVASPGAGARAGSHSVNLGPSQLIDGFGNGWRVTSAQLDALGGKSFTVSLTWTPQTREWIALALSAAGIILCLLLAFLPRRWKDRLGERWRRIRRRRREPSSAPRASAPTAVAQDVVALDPELVMPWAPEGGLPRPWVAGAVAVGTAIVVAAISYPLAGLAVGLCTGAALVWRPVRGLLRLSALGLILASALTVFIGQAMHPILESSNWPSIYEDAGTLAWMAVAFLGADAVVEVCCRIVGRRRSEGGPTPAGATGDPTGS
jgi:arabinofuranan 3-O-arabinosyltransferase